jgi:hypothetical protein
VQIVADPAGFPSGPLRSNRAASTTSPPPAPIVSARCMPLPAADFPPWLTRATPAPASACTPRSRAATSPSTTAATTPCSPPCGPLANAPTPNSRSAGSAYAASACAPAQSAISSLPPSCSPHSKAETTEKTSMIGLSMYASQPRRRRCEVIRAPSAFLSMHAGGSLPAAAVRGVRSVFGRRILNARSRVDWSRAQPHSDIGVISILTLEFSMALRHFSLDKSIAHIGRRSTQVQRSNIPIA